MGSSGYQRGWTNGRPLFVALPTIAAETYADHYRIVDDEDPFFDYSSADLFAEQPPGGQFEELASVLYPEAPLLETPSAEFNFLPVDVPDEYFVDATASTTIETFDWACYGYDDDTRIL